MDQNNNDSVHRRNSNNVEDEVSSPKPNISRPNIHRINRISISNKNEPIIFEDTDHAHLMELLETNRNLNAHLISRRETTSDDELEEFEQPEQPPLNFKAKAKRFLHFYKKSFVHRSLRKNKDEVLAGFAVALAQVPEGLAFSIVARVPPIIGMNATFIMCLVTALIGGRPGMISGATGAISVSQAPIVEKYGIEVLFMTMVFTGVIQISIGLLKGGKLIKLLSEPVMIGFLNGLAIIIGLSQLDSFRETCGETLPTDCPYISGIELLYLLLFVFGAFVFILLMPLIPKVGKIIPPTLLALIIATIINKFGNVNSKTIGDIASVAGKFPVPHWPNFTWTFEIFLVMLTNGFIFAISGLTEALMTIQPLDDMLKNRGSRKYEAIAQGVGNFISGFTTSLGGGAMIGQSQINVQSGGTKRLSAFVSCLLVLLIILVASSLIELIPIGALIGLMFVVVIKTFYWPTFLLYKKMKYSELIIIIVVTVVIVAINLAIGVIIGVALNGLFYSWEKGHKLYHYTTEIDDNDEIKKIYVVEGELFFGSTKIFEPIFHPNKDPDRVELDASGMVILDYSGVDALHRVVDKYNTENKVFMVSNLKEDSQKLIQKSQLLRKKNIIKENN